LSSQYYAVGTISQFRVGLSEILPSSVEIFSTRPLCAGKTLKFFQWLHLTTREKERENVTTGLLYVEQIPKIFSASHIPLIYK
jgi:hypothetical protein